MIRSLGLRHNVLQRTQQIMNGDECILLKGLLVQLVGARKKRLITSGVAFERSMLFEGEPVLARNQWFLYFSITDIADIPRYHARVVLVSCFPSTIF